MRLFLARCRVRRRNNWALPECTIVAVFGLALLVYYFNGFFLNRGARGLANVSCLYWWVDRLRGRKGAVSSVSNLGTSFYPSLCFFAIVCMYRFGLHGGQAVVLLSMAFHLPGIVCLYRHGLFGGLVVLLASMVVLVSWICTAMGVFGLALLTY